MTSSPPLTDHRGATFGRLAARVIETLGDAVDRRTKEGKSLTSIAQKIGCHRSSLSRVLNGTSANLTLRTISDILWATDFEPQDFKADAIEEICDNWVSFDVDEDIRVQVLTPITQSVILSDFQSHTVSGSRFEKPDIKFMAL